MAGMEGIEKDGSNFAAEDTSDEPSARTESERVYVPYVGPGGESFDMPVKKDDREIHDPLANGI